MHLAERFYKTLVRKGDFHIFIEGPVFGQVFQDHYFQKIFNLTHFILGQVALGNALEWAKGSARSLALKKILQGS
jgi:hypothetical protein